MELGLPRFRTIQVPQVARRRATACLARALDQPHVALSSSAMVHKPLGLLAELTHRCRSAARIAPTRSRSMRE